MRISDWSSDVCSSDLNIGAGVLERTSPDGETRALYDEIEGQPIGKVNFITRDSRNRLWISVSTRISPIAHAVRPGLRSEEHTSELQSLMRISYAVFCLKTKTEQVNWQREQKRPVTSTLKHFAPRRTHG